MQAHHNSSGGGPKIHILPLSVNKSKSQEKGVFFLVPQRFPAWRKPGMDAYYSLLVGFLETCALGPVKSFRGSNSHGGGCLFPLESSDFWHSSPRAFPSLFWWHSSQESLALSTVLFVLFSIRGICM